MPEMIPEPLLQAFSDFLAQRMGLYFPPLRWPDMLRGLARAAPQFGFAGPLPCLQGLMASPLNRRQVEILASHLSVGETYFFRQPAVFAALEREILPPLISARRATSRQLRLWSAGCCTGEEPYSLAILLARLIPDFADWKITLLGTDINPDFLARARRGDYRDWSFRGVPAWVRDGYFSSPEPGRYALRAALKRLVSFAYLNLADDVYPSPASNTNAMDIVFCRNVLMYFDAPTAQAVVRRLHRVLVNGGWLIVSPTEVSQTLFADFVAVDFDDAILYCKDDTAAPSRIRPPPAGVPERFPEPLSEPPSALPEPVPAAAVAAPPATPYATALACYARGAYAEAIEGLAGADTPQALALLARACANQGRLGEACRWGEAAVAADKCDAGLRYLLAALLEEDGRADDAVVTLKQALYLDPNHVLAHFALGNLFRRLQKPALARKHLAHARALLARHPAEAVLPDADGLSAARLIDIIAATEASA